MSARGTVTIDRSSLSLADLVIDTEGFSTYAVSVDGLGRVGKTPRETFADASPFVHGQLRTAVVREESALTLLVTVNGTSASDLATKVAALEDALDQFVYTVTVAVDGVSKAWTAYQATTQSVDGLEKPERWAAFFDDLSISIPVYPVSA